MDWWVHRIGADGAFKQLMDAGRRRDRGGDVGVVAISAMGFGERMVMMGRRLFLFHPIRQRDAFDVIQFHQQNRKTKSSKKKKNEIESFPSLSIQARPLLSFYEFRLSLSRIRESREREREREREKKKRKKRKIYFRAEWERRRNTKERKSFRFPALSLL